MIDSELFSKWLFGSLSDKQNYSSVNPKCDDFWSHRSHASLMIWYFIITAVTVIVLFPFYD